jgi:MFS family permease
MKVGLDLPPQQRVYGGFFIYSFCFGSLPPRLPDLQRMMQIGEGTLGFGLIGTAAGTLVSLSFFGPILERIGHRRSILTMIPLLALLYAIASFAGGPLSFFLLLFPVGIVIGGIEIILNLEADRTEHMIGYRIMNRAHAFWSFGFFSAGIISALIAQSPWPGTHQRNKLLRARRDRYVLRGPSGPQIQAAISISCRLTPSHHHPVRADVKVSPPINLKYLWLGFSASIDCR